MKLERAKGTRDFTPEEKILRDEVIEKIRNQFERFGFSPLETPTIERLDIMKAKGGAGDESDAFNEIFTFKDQGERDLGLRFELTFQLARFIGMNPQIKLPFKRYQFGNVFRDGPIKAGRYREFMQCDADIIGVKGTLGDAEILAMLKQIFKELGIEVEIEVNNRILLNEIMEYAGIDEDKRVPALITIDKLKKIGKEGVRDELIERGINDDSIQKIFEIILTEGDALESIQNIIPDSIGIKQLKELFDWDKEFGTDASFTPTLARGLGYYTGTVFEVVPKDTSIVNCSLAGGGRWDKMIPEFLGNPKLNYPATGVGVGLEPIMEIMKQKLGMQRSTNAKIYLIPIGTTKETIKIITQLRQTGVNCAMDLRDKGLSKNLTYADSLGIPYVGLIGEEELKEDKIKVKNMKSGEENMMTIEDIKKL